MKNNLIGKRYAKALLDVAIGMNQIDRFEQELAVIKDSFLSEEKTMSFFASKLISAQEKKDVLAAVYEGKISDEIVQLFNVVIDKHREESILDIIESFQQLADAERNIAVIDCYSSEVVPEEEKERLVQRFSELLKKNIKISTHIDKDLLGGLKVKYRDQVIDGTIINKLDQYKNVLTK